MTRKATTAAARRRAANSRANERLPQSNTHTTDEWLRADELVIDPMMGERKYNARRAKRIAQTIDPDALGVLYVSKRRDGTYVVIDGQHRRGAFIELGWGDQKMPCHVYHGLTLADEARLFAEFNE